MRGSLASAGPSQQMQQQQHAAVAAAARHASESALLRRELGAADRALAQRRAIHLTTRGTRRCCGRVGAAEADLARAVDQDLEARVRTASSSPSSTCRRPRRRAPSPAQAPPGLAAFAARHRDRAVAPLVREQGYKELFDAALAVHVACRARSSPQRGDGSEVHI